MERLPESFCCDSFTCNGTSLSSASRAVALSPKCQTIKATLARDIAQIEADGRDKKKTQHYGWYATPVGMFEHISDHGATYAFDFAEEAQEFFNDPQCQVLIVRSFYAYVCMKDNLKSIWTEDFDRFKRSIDLAIRVSGGNNQLITLPDASRTQMTWSSFLTQTQSMALAEK